MMILDHYFFSIFTSKERMALQIYDLALLHKTYQERTFIELLLQNVYDIFVHWIMHMLQR
jgi:hypothetical protein